MTFWFEEPNYVVEERTYTEKHPYIAIPYLLGISLAVLVGTTGNILIIGAIYVSEVTHYLLYSISYTVTLYCTNIRFNTAIYSSMSNIVTVVHKTKVGGNVVSRSLHRLDTIHFYAKVINH